MEVFICLLSPRKYLLVVFFHWFRWFLRWWSLYFQLIKLNHRLYSVMGIRLLRPLVVQCNEIPIFSLFWESSKTTEFSVKNFKSLSSCLVSLIIRWKGDKILGQSFFPQRNIYVYILNKYFKERWLFCFCWEEIFSILICSFTFLL